MNSIEFFMEEDFKGRSVSIDSDCPNLEEKGFNNTAKSIKVIGDYPWVVYNEKNYKGHDFRILRPGLIHSIPADKEKISSARVINGGLLDPKITLYEHINYGGKVKEIDTGYTSLDAAGFDNMVSSIKVQAGAWHLYSDKNYRGVHIIFLAGDNIHDFRTFGWNDKLSSIKPEPEYE